MGKTNKRRGGNWGCWIDERGNNDENEKEEEKENKDPEEEKMTCQRGKG